MTVNIYLSHYICSCVHQYIAFAFRNFHIMTSQVSNCVHILFQHRVLSHRFGNALSNVAIRIAIFVKHG